MKAKLRALCALMVMFLLVFSVSGGAFAGGVDDADNAAADTAAYILSVVKAPQVGSVGGEWAVIGLSRSGVQLPEQYCENYYAAVVRYVEACGGVLHEKKYTEYSRLVLALTAIGRDPADVGGYNLLVPLGDFEKTVWQGVNGAIWALIALDSADYEIPENPGAAVQATRQRYVDEILNRQLADGGFSLTGTGGGAQRADPDITAMALQALAKYQQRADVRQAAQRALSCLSGLQDSTGGFFDGAGTCENTAQTIVALTELGISPDDARFVKNGHTLLDNLLTYAVAGGGFRHLQGTGGSNQMTTEQAFCALVSIERQKNAQPTLYRMRDVEKQTGGIDPDSLAVGLEGKNADVMPMPVTAPGKTFDDIEAHANRSAIEALAARGIVNGRSDTAFAPDATMTRAEFAAIIVRSLGLLPKENAVFQDVAAKSWYAPYVGCAYSYGIVKGTSPVRYTPSGTVTRQEAAVMTARAAKLCGMNTQMTEPDVRDMLAQFEDYVKSADWARESLAFCYAEDILPQSDLSIRPAAPILRAEMAQMLFHLLVRAKLL